MDASGKVIANLEGDRTIDGFQGMMKAGQEYHDFKAKADKGDPVAKIEFFVRALKLGEFKLDAARKYNESLKGVTPEQKARIDGEIVGLEVNDLLEPLNAVRDRAKAKELQIEAGKKFWAMDQAGRIPSGDDQFGPFYGFMLLFAESEKNIPAFEKALGAMKDHFGPRLRKEFLQAKEEILEKMKSEKAEKDPKEGGDKKDK